LRAKGAEVERAGADYEVSLEAARRAAVENGWHLLSDSSWPGYAAWPLDVMEGYLAMGAEVAEQIGAPPTHIFLQAGVGGLAAAAGASARAAWGDAPMIVVVEPEAARALFEGVQAGRALNVPGPVSNMGRLDCKEASHLALGYLAREADAFMTISDAEAAAMVAELPAHGLDSSPSGAAGLAGLACVDADAVGLDGASRVLVYLSEGPVDE
jgi:diaminopropionate ammonia-lyase